MKTPIKNNLKEFRLKAGLLQKDVAVKLNISDSQDRICHWEKEIGSTILLLLIFIRNYKKRFIGCLSA